MDLGLTHVTGVVAHMQLIVCRHKEGVESALEGGRLCFHLSCLETDCDTMSASHDE